MCNWVIGSLLILVLAGCEPGAGCDLVKLAQVPLEPRNGLFLVPLTVDGHVLRMELDTGSTRSFLFEATVQRLGIVQDSRTATIMAGMSGWSLRGDASIDSVSIGGVPVSVERMPISTLGGSPTFDGLVGLDVLRDFDLDIDARNRSLALYRVRRCEPADPPWEEPATRITGTSTRTGWLEIPFEINGVEEPAVVDTGASYTRITPRFARRLGLTEQDLANDRIVRLHVVAAEDTQARAHRFQTVRIGPVTLHDTSVIILAKDPPALGGGRYFSEAAIGQDFLSHRRVWFSIRTGRLYISRAPGDTVTE